MEEDEGLVVSGHILIKKDRNANSRSHLILIEKVTGLSMSKVEAYFKYILKNNTEKYYLEEGEQMHYRPIFEILGKASGTIRDAITNNTLQDIELVGHTEVSNGFDEFPYIQEQTQQAKFIIKTGIETDTIDPFFAIMLNKFRTGNYEKMFVRIKTTNGLVKQTKVNTDSEDMLTQAFICNEYVSGFTPELESACEEIRNDMSDKLQRLAQQYD